MLPLLEYADSRCYFISSLLSHSRIFTFDLSLMQLPKLLHFIIKCFVSFPSVFREPLNNSRFWNLMRCITDLNKQRCIILGEKTFCKRLISINFGFEATSPGHHRCPKTTPHRVGHVSLREKKYLEFIRTFLLMHCVTILKCTMLQVTKHLKRRGSHLRHCILFKWLYSSLYVKQKAFLHLWDKAQVSKYTVEIVSTCIYAISESVMYRVVQIWRQNLED